MAGGRRGFCLHEINFLAHLVAGNGPEVVA